MVGSSLGRRFGRSIAVAAVMWGVSVGVAHAQATIIPFDETTPLYGHGGDVLGVLPGCDRRPDRHRALRRRHCVDGRRRTRHFRTTLQYRAVFPDGSYIVGQYTD